MLVARKWKAFADANGITFVSPGPGDREIWAFGKLKFDINHHKDELDFASVRTASKLLNASVLETIDAIRQGRTIKARDYSKK
jgi:hypothetical protein